MIRRDPTLIALSDIDVQDVREFRARREYESQAAAGSTASDSASIAAGNSVSSGLMKEYRDFAVKREALAKLTKDQRLGL